MSVIALILSLLGASLLGMAYGENKMSLQQTDQLQTYYIADAGVEYALARAVADPAWLDGLDVNAGVIFPEQSFAGGKVQVTLKKMGGEDGVTRLYILSTGLYNANKRTLEARAAIEGKSIRITYWQERYHVFPKRI